MASLILPDHILSLITCCHCSSGKKRREREKKLCAAALQDRLCLDLIKSDFVLAEVQNLNKSVNFLSVCQYEASVCDKKKIRQHSKLSLSV